MGGTLEGPACLVAGQCWGLHRRRALVLQMHLAMVLCNTGLRPEDLWTIRAAELAHLVAVCA